MKKGKDNKGRFQYKNYSDKGVEMISASKQAMIIPKKEVEAAQEKKIKEISELNKLKEKTLKENK